MQNPVHSLRLLASVLEAKEVDEVDSMHINVPPRVQVPVTWGAIMYIHSIPGTAIGSTGLCLTLRVSVRACRTPNLFFNKQREIVDEIPRMCYAHRQIA